MAKALRDLLKEEGAPEELITSASLADVPDLATLAKRLIDTKAFVGQSLRVPAQDATPEVRKAFDDDLAAKVPGLVRLPNEDGAMVSLLRERGILPKDGAGYTAPEGVQLTDEELVALRKDAVEEGLTRSQFQRRARARADERAVARKVIDDSRSAVKTHLGEAYDQRMAFYADVAEAIDAPKNLKAAIAARQIDVETASMLDRIGKQLGQAPREVAGQPGGKGLGLQMTPAEAEAKSEEITGQIIADPKMPRAIKEAKLLELRRLAPMAHPEEVRQRYSDDD